MPNRYIRESAITSKAVNRLGWQAEVFWRRLLNRVDDFGRFTANCDLLRASIFPLQLQKVSNADVGRLLLECEQAGLLSTWNIEDGDRFLVVHKWEKGRAKRSKYPEPPEEIRQRLQTYVYTCLQPFTNVPDTDSDSDTDIYIHPPRGKPKSCEEALEYAKGKPGYELSIIQHWFAQRDSQNWIKANKHPVTNWRSDLDAWVLSQRHYVHPRTNGNGIKQLKLTEAERDKANTGLDPIKVRMIA